MGQVKEDSQLSLCIRAQVEHKGGPLSWEEAVWGPWRPRGASSRLGR